MGGVEILLVDGPKAKKVANMRQPREEGRQVLLRLNGPRGREPRETGPSCDARVPVCGCGGVFFCVGRRNL